jgi:hypothetical protein
MVMDRSFSRVQLKVMTKRTNRPIVPLEARHSQAAQSFYTKDLLTQTNAYFPKRPQNARWASKPVDRSSHVVVHVSREFSACTSSQ